jgi:1-acyl-sn-glycerol-3-phosphate acyltransferase
MWIHRLTNFFVLGSIKLLARLFYRVENEWIHRHDGDPWGGVKIVTFLNHTSLYEPLFLGAIPWRILWRFAGRIVIPAADITINRPIVGKIFRAISPRLVPISRKRDETWDRFLDEVRDESIVIILPEGRMKRATGLDKKGNRMSVRGGIADILELIPDGEMVIIYSGGLHHVQVPGQRIPNLFKHIQIRCEKVSIQEYVNEMSAIPESNFKRAVIDDMESRLERNNPRKSKS